MGYNKVGEGGLHMKRNYLDQFYTVDEESGDYIIEITIQDYDDIFNSWDSSLYNIRDLDSSLKAFIEECSRDIDINKKVTLRFNIQKETKDPELENTISNGIRNFFEYYAYITKRKLRERNKKALIFIGISAAFTISSFFLRNELDPELFQHFILESLTVGGWIFMWEAFSYLFILSNDERKKKKEYRRLMKAPMLFRYK